MSRTAQVILPLVASLLLGLNARFSFSSKWATLRSAALHTESEIYRYRKKNVDTALCCLLSWYSNQILNYCAVFTKCDLMNE